MSDHRIPPQDVCMCEAMQFAQHWEVRAPLPLDEIDDLGVALQPVASRMRAGDQITVCAFTDKTFRVLSEVAVFRVVAAGHGVSLLQVGKAVKVPSLQREQAERVADVLHVEPLGSGYTVVDVRGNQIETFVDEAQARSFAARENARALAAKAA